MTDSKVRVRQNGREAHVSAPELPADVTVDADRDAVSAPTGMKFEHSERAASTDDELATDGGTTAPVSDTELHGIGIKPENIGPRAMFGILGAVAGVAAIASPATNGVLAGLATLGFAGHLLYRTAKAQFENDRLTETAEASQ